MSIDVVSQHAELCLRHLMESLALGALLALTQLHAPAGQAALDLIMPILAEQADLRWPLLQLAAVMHVLGKTRCLARLQRTEAAFHRAQMIG